MKPHLPISLRNALLACFAAVASFSLGATVATSGTGSESGEPADSTITIDYANPTATIPQANGALQLTPITSQHSGTPLKLVNTGEGDGKTYTLYTGVTRLVDAEGNTITLDSTNNAISNYFDSTRPGTGFWAGGTLQLTNAGTLQLVLHDETVKAAQTITARQTNPSAYQYYAGIAFEDISYVSGSSYAYGGAIYGDGNSTITLSNNGSVTFSGNTASASSSSARGGAIYGDGNSTITLSNNGSVTFSGNTASGYSSSSYSSSSYGGAIYGDVTMTGNGDVSFSGNTAESASSDDARGGAIYGDGNSTITLSNNGSVTFSWNTASASSSSYLSSSARGGAIYGDSSSTITLSNNGSVTFSWNTASASSSSSSSYSSSAYGGAIYGDGNSTITLSDNGSVTFSGNTASAYSSSDSYASSSASSAYGGAIYGYDGTITLSDNGSVSFSGNTASASSRAYGGAIYGYDGSTITLSNNGSVTFSGNTASSSSSSSYYHARGGAIYGSTITLSDNGSVVFEGNTASSSYYYALGGAIYGDSYSTITLSDNGSVSFSGNTASASSLPSGGAIYGDSYSTITLSDNGSVSFSGNTASASSLPSGGAICGYSYSTITLSNNGSVTFSGNTAESASSSADGGAIYGGPDSTITLSDNGSVSFSGNTASGSSASGGAINGYGDITLSNNESVTFSGNMASASSYACGGAIYGDVSMTGNGDITFSGNTASGSSASGGAIYRDVTMTGNGDVSFSGNTAESSSSSASGGAIEGDVTMTGNGDVSFSGNTAESSSSYARGGAIDGDVSMTGNGDITFSGNTAESSSSDAWGGAIYGDVSMTGNGDITFSGNTAESSSSDAWGGTIRGSVTMTGNGDVTFSGNTATGSSYVYGGAIYGSVTMEGNSAVTFSGNTASAPSDSIDSSVRGGAIYAYGNLSIRNNDSVEFYQNAEVENGTYRLRSIYNSGGYRDVSLSAAVGKSIEFRDSVYIASGSTVNLNADYTYLDEAGESVTIRQTGDIIFTGKYAETHLNEILAADEQGRNATAEEIRLSRTTEVCAMTNLYGGRLRVEDGSIYQGYGITVHEGSEATVLVKDATLSHTGYDLIFNAGTALHAAGVSSITGNVVMLQGSHLALTVGAVNGESAVLTLGTAMDLQGVNLLVEGAEYLLSGEYKLIADSGYNSGDWKTDVVQVNGCTAESLVWKNGVLTLICTNAANKAVDNGAIVGDTNANIVVGNGAAVTIAGAIAADAETGAAGHLIINNGHAELVEGGRMAGHVVFANAGTGAARELTVATDASVDAVVLSGSADGTVAVETGHELVAGTLEGKGSMVKTGGGTMTHDGEDSTVQGRVEIREGRFENTGNLVASQIEVSGGHLENQGTISHVELSAGTLSGCGVFGGLTMKGGVLVIGNSPGFQQYTDDLVAEGGELVFSVSGLENAATAESESWVSETYSQIDMGGYELSLGDDTTLTIALGGSLLENLEGEFNMQLFDNVGNIEAFTHGMLTLMLENTRFVVTTEAEGLCGDWEAGAALSLWVHGVQYRVADSGIVLSGRFGAIPEPATSTLSLLALAALAARRRRK